jgi:hypothetical protein
MDQKIESLILEKLTYLEKDIKNIDKRLMTIELQIRQDKKDISNINSILNSKAFIIAMDEFSTHAGDVKEVTEILSKEYNSKTGYEIFANLIEEHSNKLNRNSFIKNEFLKQTISRIVQGIVILVGIALGIMIGKK